MGLVALQFIAQRVHQLETKVQTPSSYTNGGSSCSGPFEKLDEPVLGVAASFCQALDVYSLIHIKLDRFS